MFFSRLHVFAKFITSTQSRSLKILMKHSSFSNNKEFLTVPFDTPASPLEFNNLGHFSIIWCACTARTKLVENNNLCGYVGLGYVQTRSHTSKRVGKNVKEILTWTAWTRVRMDFFFMFEVTLSNGFDSLNFSKTFVQLMNAGLWKNRLRWHLWVDQKR